MISGDEYPVYNHRERPAIGRDTSGETYFNCFSIRLERDQQGSLLPYTFSDFLRHYDAYADHSGTCESCISQHKTVTFKVDDGFCDLSAAERKFYPDDVNEADYYYCPLIRDVLSASRLKAEQAPPSAEDLPAEPIWAVLAGNWDDDWLMEFESIGSPKKLDICPIYRQMVSDAFVATVPERRFLSMWMCSMFYSMEAVRASGEAIYLEQRDFRPFDSKLLDFVFPVPQVWVKVIPKPPPGRDWNEWEELQRAESQPQRVDFLLVQGGCRHVIELDDIGHYAIRLTTGDWEPSEPRYRETLLQSRVLRRKWF